MGVIIAEDKTQGPGVEFAMELRLTQEKLSTLHDALTLWRGRRSGKRKDLESLVGLLQHASEVVRPGRVFLQPSRANKLLQTSSFCVT